MKILDLDMDYFMRTKASDISEDETARLSEEDYGDSVWTEVEVRDFLEKNLGLSKQNKIRGRIVIGHNESLFFWKELIEQGRLSIPFEVIHVDSHADLGLGCSSWKYIREYLLGLDVEERPIFARHLNSSGKIVQEGIGDYLLYAIAYRWISRLFYCGNPSETCNDYIWDILKDFKEEFIWDKPVKIIIQLLYNPDMDHPGFNDSDYNKRLYIQHSKKEPEVPFVIIPTVEDVKYSGDFDFAVLAQSPNYTPSSADFIMDIFREYIIEE